MKILELEEKSLELAEVQMMSGSKQSLRGADNKTILNTVHEESKENLLD